MIFPKYPAYKPSGVEWLGDVPAHWDVCALKRFATLKSGDGITSEKIYAAGDYAVYGGNGLRGFTSAYTHEGRYAIIGRQGALCGNVNYSQGKFWASEHAVVATPVKPSDTTYLGELMRAMNMNQYSVSAAQPGLSVELISNIGVPYPPLNEQSAIATFLTHETAKIDALIAEQEKLIALLAEKRQATISHAVTKGLYSRHSREGGNPAHTLDPRLRGGDEETPMKDSGVAWIGEVPGHWEVVPLKYLVNFRSGGTPSKEKLNYWNGDVPWASAKDLKTDRLTDTIDHITLVAIEEKAAELIPRGAVLVVVRGMILARIFPVSIIDTPMAINQDLKAVIPGERIGAEFLAWLLRGTSDDSLRRLDEAGHGTKALRMDAWASMLLPVPPIPEQAQIAQFIEREMTRLAQLQHEAERAIALLKERRSAVIAAAVTGKMDVRGIIPKEIDL